MNMTMNDKMKVIEGDLGGRGFGSFGLSIGEYVHEHDDE